MKATAVIPPPKRDMIAEYRKREVPLGRSPSAANRNFPSVPDRVSELDISLVFFAYSRGNRSPRPLVFHGNHTSGQSRAGKKQSSRRTRNEPNLKLKMATRTLL